MPAHLLKSVTFTATTLLGQVNFNYAYDSTTGQRQIDRALGFTRIKEDKKGRQVNFYDSTFALNQQYGYTAYCSLDQRDNVVSLSREGIKILYTYDQNGYLSTLDLIEGTNKPQRLQSFTVLNGNITQVNVSPSHSDTSLHVVEFEYDEQRQNPFESLYFGTDQYIGGENYNMLLMAPYPELKLGRSSRNLPVRKKVTTFYKSKQISVATYEYVYQSNQQGQLISVEERFSDKKFTPDNGKTWHPTDKHTQKTTVTYSY